MAARKNHPASNPSRRVPLFRYQLHGFSDRPPEDARAITMSQFVLLDTYFKDLGAHRGWVLAKRVAPVRREDGTPKLDIYGRELRQWLFSVWVRDAGRLRPLDMNKQQQRLRDAERAWESGQFEVQKWRKTRQQNGSRKPTNTSSQS